MNNLFTGIIPARCRRSYFSRNFFSNPNIFLKSPIFLKTEISSPGGSQTAATIRAKVTAPGSDSGSSSGVTLSQGMNFLQQRTDSLPSGQASLLGSAMATLGQYTAEVPNTYFKLCKDRKSFAAFSENRYKSAKKYQPTIKNYIFARRKI